MGHPLRLLTPDTTYFVTINCSERRFFLRPDAEITEWVAYWLARANRRHPQILLQGVVVMSNHIHLLVRDRGSSLSGFMGYFAGNLAKGINRQRRRMGKVFDRRFASAAVLDNAALADRLAYIVDNPVKAGLVQSFEEWPGLLLWSQDGGAIERSVLAFDRVGYERAVAAAGRGRRKPSREDYEYEETLYVRPPDPIEDDGLTAPERSACVMNDVRQRQLQHVEERRAKKESVLGAAKVRAQDWRGAPARIKRSPRPLCHAGAVLLRVKYVAEWWKLREAYAEASVAFRAGDHGVQFPDCTFRPPAGFYQSTGARTDLA